MADEEPYMTEEEAESLDILVGDFTLMSFMLDGIVVDPKTAMDRRIACRYAEFTKKNGEQGRVTWKKGIVGALTKEQTAQFCDPAVEQQAYGQVGIQQHIEAFERASEECVAEEPAGETEPGARIAARIDCMSRELRHST